MKAYMLVPGPAVIRCDECGLSLHIAAGDTFNRGFAPDGGDECPGCHRYGTTELRGAPSGHTWKRPPDAQARREEFIRRVWPDRPDLLEQARATGGAP